MLSLLTLDQAVLYILSWSKQIPDPTDGDALQNILNDETLRPEYFRYKMFLQNAIDAGLLPAHKKPKPKAEEKKIMEKLGIPEEIRGILQKNYDIWITWQDLLTFIEQPEYISERSYSHAREALARVAWMLAKKADLSMDSAPLQIELDNIVIDMESQEIHCKLGESTLKGCVREILAAGDDIQNQIPE